MEKMLTTSCGSTIQSRPATTARPMISVSRLLMPLAMRVPWANFLDIGGSIRHDKAVNKRTERAEQLFHHVPDERELDQHERHENAAADNAESGQSPLKIVGLLAEF